MASSANQLSIAAACYIKSVSRGDQWGVVIYLLNQIAGTNMTAEQLNEASACFIKSIPRGDQEGVMIYLLNQILANGGTGGSSGVIRANYGGVTPTASAATYTFAYDTSNDTLWASNGTSWNQLV